MRGSLFFLFFISILIFSAYSLEIESSAFKHNQKIPLRYTCDSLDLSPPLTWKDIPAKTQSFALICEDPDAPAGLWVHWIIFNIPKETLSLPEGIAKVANPFLEAQQGINDFGRVGYAGLCPPPGKSHRYFFRLYALDTKLQFSAPLGREDLLKSISGHILGEAELVGIYQR